MATVSATSSNYYSVTVTISGLQYPANQYDGFRMRVSAGAYNYDSNWTSTSTSYSTSKTQSNLSGSTTYTVDVWATWAGVEYHVGTTTVTTQEKPRTRPTNFWWTYDKISGNNFNLRASEWNDFIDRINSFRYYKYLPVYSFTYAYAGNDFTANMFNQAVNAIKDMSPPTAPPSTKAKGADIFASYLNGLVTSLNSIP